MKLKVMLFVILSIVCAIIAYSRPVILKPKISQNLPEKNMLLKNNGNDRPYPVGLSAYLPKRAKVLKRAQVVLIVISPSGACGTLDIDGVAGLISNCGIGGPDERDVAFLVDPAAGFSTNLTLSNLPVGHWQVTIQGYGNAIPVYNGTSGTCHWAGTVPIDPNLDVTRIAVVARQS